MGTTVSEHLPSPPGAEDMHDTDPEPSTAGENLDREAGDDTAVDPDVIAHAVADPNAPFWCVGVASAG
jgi:hypothetical protein